MAGGQSSSHHEERRHRSDRERERSGSSHHSRTISSTTLLLVLSLVLAVLAVMLSLPSGNSSATPTGDQSGMFGLFTPKRSSALISREGAVAHREAEVARREAEILVGAPGGVVPTPALACPPCLAVTTIETVTPPAHTIIKEIVKEDSLTPPGWSSPRIEDMIERELKIAERERDISKREEQVNRREHDASRRETWIMEQLITLGNDGPHAAVEEEYVYEPVGVKRKAKYQELPPLIVSEYEYAYGTQTKALFQTQTVNVPPANTRLAPFPTPEAATSYKTESSPRTTAVEIVHDESPRTIVRPPARPQARRFPAAGEWW